MTYDDDYYSEEWQARESYLHNLAIAGEIEEYWRVEQQKEKDFYDWFYRWKLEMEYVFNPFGTEFYGEYE